jgi:hypothetical protein
VQDRIASVWDLEQHRVVAQEAQAADARDVAKLVAQ